MIGAALNWLCYALSFCLHIGASSKVCCCISTPFSKLLPRFCCIQAFLQSFSQLPASHYKMSTKRLGRDWQQLPLEVSRPQRWIVIPMFHQWSAAIENPSDAMVARIKTIGTHGWWSCLKTIVTIPSFDQWKATIKNHPRQWYIDKNIDHSIVLKN